MIEAWCVEVAVRPSLEDPAALLVAGRLASLGLEGRVLAVRGFLLPAGLGESELKRAAAEVLADPISDRYRIAAPGTGDASLWQGYDKAARLVVRRRPGVTDAVARSVREALGELGIRVDAAGTYRAWLFPLELGPAERRRCLEELGRELANEVIEEVLLDRLPEGLPGPSSRPLEARVELPLSGLDGDDLVELSKRHCFSLSQIEMEKIQAWFDESEGRAPTLTELETLAQTWSEHCKHKTLAGRIRFEDTTSGESRSYENLLRETIFEVTRELDRPWCVSVFEDNAGVVDFDGKDCLCIKVETHNHPSAIEPFGGAGTGIGGVIRDILGTGLGAKPLCSLDVFCVAPPDLPWEELPAGSLHPARVLDGIVAGVRDYGNPMGIPTVTGAVHFDPAFVGNPLVYCGTVGLVPKHKVLKAARPGDRILLAGGRTGRDGIHGATFSSVELHEESETVSSGAVQIGDPITEKKLTDALLEARDKNLFTAITDCGAGGLSSAVGEMGRRIGARADTSRVPLKYEGLTPTETWISEAQERMVFAVPPKKLERFREVFARYEVEVSDIGEFSDSGRLEIWHRDEKIADLDMGFLHDGLPRVGREALYRAAQLEEPELPEPSDLGSVLLGALSDHGVASKEWILRQYDHEVQGGSLAKPFSGPRQRGPGDAAVCVPKASLPIGFAVGTGLNPRYSWIDPAAMAEAALDEALRNVVVKGGDPGTCAVLDNYCWGNTDDPEQLGALVRATEALCELARVYRTPFISGKDSLNNEYRVGDETISIPGCLLVTALAPVTAVESVPDSAFTGADHAVYLLGETLRELGGSVYYKLEGQLGASVPRARGADHYAVYRALHAMIQEDCILAAHDLSEGGLGVAAAEMALGGEVGVFLDLANAAAGMERADEILFSESLGRILVEVHPEQEATLCESCAQSGIACSKIGVTMDEATLTADAPDGSRILTLGLAECREAWQRPLARGPLAVMPERNRELR
ncbi:MAG: phosphoribosylformylglycinamidine synthase subunit PurL [Planctomycetota bacterium]